MEVPETFPKKIKDLLEYFYTTYQISALSNGADPVTVDKLFSQLVEYVGIQLKTPFIFEPYHRKIRSPIDYTQFGLDFFKQLIQMDQSKLWGENNLTTIQAQLKAGENVILLSNHQIEPDPQVIQIMLQNSHPEVCERLIFVAGDRVITDPMAIPFSLGCNLICIFSKKHVENPPEKKYDKLVHNQQTMSKMAELLAQGGHCIYVAPSGGRDRPNKAGKILPALINSNSIDMFMLMARRAKTPTHFYPLSLYTYNLLPPPHIVEKEIGEQRHANAAPVSLYFGEEIVLDKIVPEGTSKQLLREERAKKIYKIILDQYKKQVS